MAKEYGATMMAYIRRAMRVQIRGEHFLFPVNGDVRSAWSIPIWTNVDGEKKKKHFLLSPLFSARFWKIVTVPWK